MSTIKKTVQLNISERLNALKVLNEFKGNLDKLAVILEDIKQLPATEEEWVKAERIITPAPSQEDPGASTWKWDDEKGGTKEIILDKDTVDYVRKVIDERNSKGEFGLSDKAFITLLGKLV